jgi:hypothetical protein
MVEKESAKPQRGLWDELPKTDEKRPKLEFKTDVTAKVTFETNEPREYPNVDSDGVFYVFDVIFKDEKMAIVTSAWTLLKELKKLSPLKDKVVLITKKSNKGKQSFDVREFNEEEELEDY